MHVFTSYFGRRHISWVESFISELIHCWQGNDQSILLSSSPNARAQDQAFKIKHPNMSPSEIKKSPAVIKPPRRTHAAPVPPIRKKKITADVVISHTPRHVTSFVQTCMHVYACVCVGHACLCMQVFELRRVCMCTGVCVETCMHMYVCVYVEMGMPMHACVCVKTCMQMYACVCFETCMHMYAYVCVHAHMCVVRVCARKARLSEYVFLKHGRDACGLTCVCVC